MAFREKAFLDGVYVCVRVAVIEVEAEAIPPFDPISA